MSTFVEVDERGWYVDASTEALAVYGVSLEELRTHRIGDFAPPGWGAIHLALFRWVVTRARDFGGGSGTIVRPDGRATTIDCGSIRRMCGRFRIEFAVRRSGSVIAPRSEATAAVLDTWREAERDVAQGTSNPRYDLATTVAGFLRQLYHSVVARKAAEMESTAETTLGRATDAARG